MRCTVLKVINVKYPIGRLCGLQVGKHRMTAYVSRPTDPNDWKDIQVSYSKQLSQDRYEVVYVKDLSI